jgi:antitoxin MazE
MGAGTVEKISKVARWGNSLGFRIPQEGVDLLKLKEGESVRVRVKGSTITICRARPRRKWTEKELLKGVTPAMCGPDLVPNRSGREII